MWFQRPLNASNRFAEAYAFFVRQVSEQEHIDAVLMELQRAKETGASVMGRILNPVNAGYAVGIGGLVCFCPMTQCLYQVRTPAMTFQIWVSSIPYKQRHYSSAACSHQR